MKKFLVLPTWLIIRCASPFLPRSHPWKDQKFSLRDWYVGATPFTLLASTVIWFSVLNLIILYRKLH